MKALLFANTDWYLWNFRLPLAKALREQGWEVVLVSPPGPWGAGLEREGFRWIPFPFSRRGTNPAKELAVVGRLVSLYRQEQPDLVHHFTIKCVLYGGIAARLAGLTHTVSSITGMGHIFTTPGMRTAILRPLVAGAYRLALSGSHVVFQNPDDWVSFDTAGHLHEAHVHLIRGSGVDTRRFCPPTRRAAKPVQVILVARLLKEKGIEEFVHAATLLHARGVKGKFVVVGDLDDGGNPSSHTLADLLRWKAEGTVEFLGNRDDVPSLLQASHIACLPSWREGTPRSLLEAMATGLPAVTTDVPGCREVVSNGVNGFLVPVRDPEALAEALQELIEDPVLRKSMGELSRHRACQEFAQESVIDRTLDVYEQAVAPASDARDEPTFRTI